MKCKLLLLMTLFSSAILAQSFDIEGHRGCRGLYPENTIPAFIEAVRLGVNTLEMDIVVSKDGKLVISHDPYMNDVICTKPDGTPVTAEEAHSLRIYEMNYADIIQYDCGLRGNPRFPDQHKMAVYKPLLKDVIDTVEKYVKANHLPPVYYNIETKSTIKGDDVYHPTPAIFTNLFYNAIVEKQVVNRCILQSFDIRTLQEIKKIDPHVTTALLIENLDGLDRNLDKLGVHPDIYSPDYKLITEKLIEKCHALHIRVLPWTVNEEKSMLRLKNMGVDGIISDYPDRAIKTLR